MQTESLVISREESLSSADFIDILKRSSLAERRPVEDSARIDRMLTHANLLITARDGKKLVGVARALTDFCYCCYLSDLAVDETYQNQGIGRKLIEAVRQHIGEKTLLLLLAAPAAKDYYARVGFTHEEAAWSIRPKR
jgi:predicted N-acetyltransferase YhbS